jgi:hypothetical protein
LPRLRPRRTAGGGGAHTGATMPLLQPPGAQRTPPQRTRWRYALAALSILFFAPAPPLVRAATSGRLPSGEPVCRDGAWTEASQEALNAGTAVPLVQCWRDTPCVQSHYMTFEKCAQMVEEADFPATDPLLTTNSSMRTMAHLARGLLANRTLLFVGDSIMGQVFDAARCDLLRWGLTLVEVSENVDLAAQGVDAETAARCAAYVEKTKAGFGRGYPCTGDKASDTGCVWFPDPPGKPWVIPQTGTIVGFKGWHKFKPQDTHAYLGLTDAVIVNYALHYSNMTEYEDDMRGLMHALGVHGAQRGKAAVFRETTAQHFIGTGSFASMEQAHLQLGSRCSCGEMSPEVAANNDVTRRNALAAAAAAAHAHVRMLGLYDLTVPRHALHEESFCDFEAEADRRRQGLPAKGAHGCCDCTHLCYTPQLWGHLWDRLAAALETTHLVQRRRHRHSTEEALPVAAAEEVVAEGAVEAAPLLAEEAAA